MNSHTPPLKSSKRTKSVAIKINMKWFQILFLLFVFLTSACEETLKRTDTNNLDWDKDVRLTTLTDINPDPNIVEVNLEAVEKEMDIKTGFKTQMFTYNGLFPGPLIEANVGDTLIVHFTNNLREDTTVHWHGVELPAAMDGSHIAQLPVAANGGTFTYEFKLLNAATYWYHPHIQTHRQVEMGLYGALVVHDPVRNEQLKLPEKELVLMLDDIVLDAGNQIAPEYPVDPVEYASFQLNGRESDFDIRVNGKNWPIEATLTIGEPVRLRMINTANAKFFRVSIDNHLMFRIGGDAGLIERPIAALPIDVLTESSKPSNKIKGRHLGVFPNLASNPDPDLGVFLVPGERAEVVFTPKGEPGEYIYLEWHDFPKGLHSAERQTDGTIGIVHNLNVDGSRLPIRIMRFKLEAGATAENQDYIPPISLKRVIPIDTNVSLGTLPITFGHSLPDLNGNITFFATVVNGSGKPFNALLPEEGLSAVVGGTYIWEIKNLTEGDHPFHPHGFTFQHIETEYVDLNEPKYNYIVKAPFVENKDTIRVPGRPGLIRGDSWTIVRLAVTFDDTGRQGNVTAFGKVPTATTSGGWVVHCHVLEHANRGMMTFLNLIN